MDSLLSLHLCNVHDQTSSSLDITKIELFEYNVATGYANPDCLDRDTK